MNKKVYPKISIVLVLRLSFTCLLIFSVILSANAQITLKERLEQHVFTLASDEMQGRKAGTEFARMAAGYIVNQFIEAGIEPFFSDSYFQPFWNNSFNNIVGIIHGNDPIDEYIIIGAHYDHIGTLFGRIRNGADDNASGVAALIELGRELQINQANLKRSIILIAFDAEEAGLIGSTHFISRWDKPIDTIKLMISIDMVGWYQASGFVEYVGSGTLTRGNDFILNPEIIPEGLNVTAKRFETSFLVATDTHPFAAKKIPTFYVSTGLKSPYHSSRDEAHLIDFDGMTLIVEHLVNFIETISQDANLESSGRIARIHRPRRLVDFGLSFNYRSIYRHYAKSEADSLLGVGLFPQINFGILAIRPELLYDHIREINPSGTIFINNLTFPLSLVLQTPDHWIFAGDIFLGGYYSYTLNAALGAAQGAAQGGESMDTFNHGGLTFGFGYIMKPLKLGFTYRIPVNTNDRFSYTVITYTF